MIPREKSHDILNNGLVHVDVLTSESRHSYVQCVRESKTEHTSLLESVDKRRREKRRKRIFLKKGSVNRGFLFTASDSPPIRTYPAQTQLMPTHSLEWAGASHSSTGLSCSEGDVIMVFKVKKVITSFPNSPPHNPSDYRVPERLNVGGALPFHENHAQRREESLAKKGLL